MYAVLLKTVKIAYLIPEFPGQTHIFLWREMQEMARLGFQIEMISTRKPIAAIVSHAWAKEAMEETTYLFPLTLGNLLGSAGEFLRGGPAAWWRCLAAVFGASDVNLKGKFRLLAMILIGAELSRHCRKRNLPHVHVHSCGDAANIAMFARLISGLPYSLTLHGPWLTDYGPNQRQKWRWSSFGIMISNKLLAEARSAVNGDLPKVVRVAPMGVELNILKRTTPYRPWTGQGPAKVFACARLNAVKGHDDLIAAVAIVRASGIDAHLRIAGGDDSADGWYRRKLENMIAELNLGPYVTLLGAVSESTIRTELEAAHVYALDSRREGVPVSVMEAMAMQVPVAVTGVDGTVELVQNGVEGVLIRPKEPQQMADALMKILRDPKTAESMSDAARRKIERSYHSGLSAAATAECLTIVRGGKAERTS